MGLVPTICGAWFTRCSIFHRKASLRLRGSAFWRYEEQWLCHPLSVMLQCYPDRIVDCPIAAPGGGWDFADTDCESLNDLIPKTNTADGDGCIHFTITTMNLSPMPLETQHRRPSPNLARFELAQPETVSQPSHQVVCHYPGSRSHDIQIGR